MQVLMATCAWTNTDPNKRKQWLSRGRDEGRMKGLREHGALSSWYLSLIRKQRAPSPYCQESGLNMFYSASPSTPTASHSQHINNPPSSPSPRNSLAVFCLVLPNLSTLYFSLSIPAFSLSSTHAHTRTSFL